MVISSPVRLELEPWIAARPSHVGARAVAEAHPAIQYLTYDRLNPWAVAALTYYGNLLCVRKRLVLAKQLEFEDAYGRQRDENDLA